MFLNIVDRILTIFYVSQQKNYSGKKSSGTMIQNNRFVNNAYELP